MAASKWTVSVIFQNSEPKDIQFFASLREDIELQEERNPGVIKYFVLRHDEKDESVTAYTINGQLKLEEVLFQRDVKDFYSNWQVPENIWSEFFQHAGSIEANHFIMTHGHGGGYVFATSRISSDRFLNNVSNSFNSFRAFLSFAAFDHTFSDYVNKDIIKNISDKFNIRSTTFAHDERAPNLGIVPLGVFKSSITQAFKRKIAFLYFGNCFMQTIENGFLFSDSVLNMAGTEGMSRPTGTDFQYLFQIMATEDNEILAYKKIATAICDRIPIKTDHCRMKEIYKMEPERLERIKDVFSFSVNNLSKYSELKMKISSLAQNLLNHWDLVECAILNTRDDIRICRDVWETQLLGITDLLRFCKAFDLNRDFTRRRLDIIKDSILEIAKLFRDQSDPLVVARYWPYRAYELTREGGVSIYPEGASIFFPRKKFSTNEKDQFLKYYMDEFYTKNTFKHPFLDGNKWQELVSRHYYSPVPRCPQSQ